MAVKLIQPLLTAMDLRMKKSSPAAVIFNAASYPSCKHHWLKAELKTKEEENASLTACVHQENRWVPLTQDLPELQVQLSQAWWASTTDQVQKDTKFMTQKIMPNT